MLRITSLIIFLKLLNVLESKVCIETHYQNSFRVTALKDQFEYYPWHSFSLPLGTIRFLKVHGTSVKHICKHHIPENVKEVILEKIGLQYIEPGSLQNSEALQVIIRYNNLTKIERGVFNGTRIQGLILTDNNIEVIEPFSFEDMVHLEAVTLDNNRLQYWDGDWFANARILYEVSIRENLLKELPESTTKNIIGMYEKYSAYVLYGNLDFDNNQIKYIHPNAFSNLERLGTLSLSNNLLLELPEEVFKGFKFLFALYMNTNNFICFPNKTISSFCGVKRLFLGRNKMNKDCEKRIREYFSAKNDVVYF